MRRPLSLVLILLLGGAGVLGAQRAPLVLRLPASARAAALGGAFPPGAGDAAALFYYPAFPAPGISGGMHWLGADTVAQELAGEVEWLGGWVGLGMRSGSYGAGVPAVPVSERAALVGYGRTVHGVRLAATGKYLDQRRENDRGTGWALDLSAGMSAGPLRVAAAARDLGPDLHVGTVAGGRRASVPLPRSMAVAAAPFMGAPLGPVDVLPAIQVAWTRGERFTPAAGVELAYWPVVGRTFYLRAGARRPQPAAPERPFTTGAGFTGDRLGIDYAYEPLAGGRARHSVGLRWRAGG